MVSTAHDLGKLFMNIVHQTCDRLLLVNHVHELWQTVHEQCSPKALTLANLANCSRTVRQVREHVRQNILLQNITKERDFLGHILDFVKTYSKFKDRDFA